MAARCPRSAMVGPAILKRHRFFIMASGFASVRRDPARDVHGLLWDLALADVRALDRYEALDRGLYRKVVQAVVTPQGARRALVYVGASGEEGVPRADYIGGIVAAARAAGFAAKHVAELEAWGQAKSAAKKAGRFPLPLAGRG